MQVIKILLPILIILAIIYFLGPRPNVPSLESPLPSLSDDPVELAQQITAEEKTLNVKADNEARVIWADSVGEKTPYAVVYLHGFTASWAEGEPIHRQFAERYGCNLYLSRLADHGIDDEDAFVNLTADRLLASAAKALAVGKKLGDKVILMSVSTGVTLSIMLAADHPEDVSAILAFSPNIEIKDWTAKILNDPWGLQIGRLAVQGKHRQFEASPEFQKYWYAKYRMEGLVAVQHLLEYGMLEETFARVKQPFFLGYYYKNEAEQDEVVSVAAMLEMYDQLGTPEDLKRKVAFPDVKDHAMISYVTSKDLDNPRIELFKYAEEVLKLTPVE